MKLRSLNRRSEGSANEVEKHIKVLSYIYIIFSALAFLACLGLIALFAGFMSFVSINEGSSNPMFITGGIGFVFMMIVTLASLPGFLAGYGLLKNKSRGRPLAIIMEFIYLIEPPIGTALGVYALWVLFNEESKRCFQGA